MALAAPVALGTLGSATDGALRWSEVLSCTWNSAGTLSVVITLGLCTMSLSDDTVLASMRKPIPGIVEVPMMLWRKPGTGMDGPRRPSTSPCNAVGSVGSASEFMGFTPP